MNGNKKMTFPEFCNRLKEDNVIIGDDWHIYRADGRPLSRRAKNGYYVLRKMYDHQAYYFCEHRVIWYFCYGDIDEGLQINHKDFDRGNNHIENLELVSAKENINYTKDAGRLNTAKGENSGKALFTNKEVQAIRYLKEKGWTKEALKDLFGIKWGVTLNRILNGARYGDVADAADIVAIYPAIVDRTWNKNLDSKDRLNNALLGIGGEGGELKDMFKKYFYHGHDLDVNHAMLELGDILYYACALCNELGIDFSEVMYANMDELNERYPSGFSAERSINRAEGDV